jgi:hypothetical protein
MLLFVCIYFFNQLCDILGGDMNEKVFYNFDNVFFAVFLILVSDDKIALADSNVSSTMINLDRVNHQMAFDFDMPKDGKIKLNITVKDKDIVPGILTFAIQTGSSQNSEKIKEITGITGTNGVKDLEIELKKGHYYFYYELSNTTGNLSDTILGLNCQAEILPTIPNNISNLSIHSINSFDDVTKDGYEEINFGDEAKQMDLILPVTVDKAGGLLISLKQTDVYEDLEAGIYQDKECTKPVGKNFLLNATDDSTDIERSIPEKGTYYIKFTYKNEYPSDISTFKVKLYSISNEERTLSPNKTVVAYQASNDDKIIYKLDIKDTKILNFYITPYNNSKGGSAYFRLLDKNKKQLTSKSYVVNNRNDEAKYDPIIKYYTVNKGTYYLEVNADCSIYQLQSEAFDVNKQAGSSKSKAKSLKIKGKVLEGYFTISDSTSKVDWFKFTVTKSGQNVDFSIGYTLDGDLEFQILNSKGKVLYDSSKKLACEEGYYFHWVGRQYTKGTYYIKVRKGSKSSSVDYAVVLKKII